MRLRNVKNKEEIINNNEYLITNNYKFNNKNPLHIEIGMGKGDFIINNALQYPGINFIGIEKYDSVLVRALEKLKDLKLDNLKLMRLDANNIEEIFNHEVDTIYLNFSDPWPKKRHEARRLTSLNFLIKYDNIFKNKKHIVLKTDNKDLFAYSVKSFNNYNYIIDKISLDLENSEYNLNNIETEYEKKFKKKGITINFIDVTKD